MTTINIETELSRELASLRRQDGTWNPKDIVEFAKTNKDSALAAQFNWDKDKAAMQHWLLTARHLITKYAIVYEPNSKTVAVTGAVYSVPSRRGPDEGSYVSESALSGKEEWRLEVLAEQTSKLRAKKARFQHILPELKAVWKAIK